MDTNEAIKHLRSVFSTDVKCPCCGHSFSCEKETYFDQDQEDLECPECDFEFSVGVTVLIGLDPFIDEKEIADWKEQQQQREKEVGNG